MAKLAAAIDRVADVLSSLGGVTLTATEREQLVEYMKSLLAKCRAVSYRLFVPKAGAPDMTFPLPCPVTDRRAFVRTLAAGVALAATGVRAQPAPEPAGQDAVTVDAALAEVAAGRAVLIDIREPHEHAGGVAPGARLLPSSQLASRWTEIPQEGRPVYLVCATQNRSRSALRALRERGSYANVRYVIGGMTEWARRGLPLVKP